MSRSVKFSDEGKRTLQTLHIENQREIKQALKDLAKDLKMGKALTGRLQGFHSLRVRKYRAIYSHEGEAIVIHVVGHRREVYERSATGFARENE